MHKYRALILVALACTSLGRAAYAQGQLNIICAVQAEHCNLVQTVFARTTGIKVNLVHKGSGEAGAQINAERANPKTDIWYGGTGDPHFQAAENDLTIAYKSPVLPQLHDWAQKQATQASYKTVGIYSGPLGISHNTELLAKHKLAAPTCWKDLLDAKWKGEIQAPKPNTSGTAYVLIATLVQFMGEKKAFAYEEPGEAADDFPVVSIIKGARNLENAKLDVRMPDFKKAKMIGYDYAKYGSSAERKRLIERWEKDINSQPNS